MDIGASSGVGDRNVEMSDAQTKAKVANLETTQSRFREIEAASSNPTVARKIGNETIGVIVVLICIAVAFFMLFFAV